MAINENLGWQEAAVLLWGEDFVAPMSECLGVNRRTVSRWKTGVIDIPPEVAMMLTQSTPRQTMTRDLGDVMRRIAGGASVRDVREQIENQGAALRRYMAMRETGMPLAMIVDRSDDD